MARDLLALALWLGVLAACLHLGRGVAPWIEGPGLYWVAAGLLAAGLAGLAWGLGRLRGLEPMRRRRAGLILAGVALALAGLAWLQPMFIERTHLLLYGMLGILVYRITRRLRPAWRALYWAAWGAALGGVLDEIGQYLHPQRVGGLLDAATNAVAGGLCACALWALEPQAEPQPQTGTRAQVLWALGGLALWAGLMVLLGVLTV